MEAIERMLPTMKDCLDPSTLENVEQMVATLKELDQYQLHESRSKVIQSVEHEFDKCINALLERKKAILNEVESSFQIENILYIFIVYLQMTHKETKALLYIQEVGETICNTNATEAMEVWNNAPKFVDLNTISVHFSSVLLEHISKHGSVELVSGPLADPVTTLAGSTQGNADGSGSVAQFNTPVFGCFNHTDNSFYVSDCGNHSIRKIDGRGLVTTFAAQKGDNQLSYPLGIVHYRKEDCFFVCSQNQHTIKKINSAGTITTFVGSGNQGFADGIGENSSFNYPCGIAIDQQTGTLFISDFSNHAIRKVSPEGEVSTLAGTGKLGNEDGFGNFATFYGPSGICLDEKEQTLTVCDFNNYKLRKLDLRNGEVSTICPFNSPYGIAVTSRNAFVVSSRNSHKLMIVTLEGGKYESKPLAGSGIQGYEDGEPIACQFNFPCGVSVDHKTSKCFVVEYSNNRIRTLHLR